MHMKLRKEVTPLLVPWSLAPTFVNVGMIKSTSYQSYHAFI